MHMDNTNSSSAVRTSENDVSMPLTGTMAQVSDLKSDLKHSRNNAEETTNLSAAADVDPGQVSLIVVYLVLLICLFVILCNVCRSLRNWRRRRSNPCSTPLGKPPTMRPTPSSSKNLKNQENNPVKSGNHQIASLPPVNADTLSVPIQPSAIFLEMDEEDIPISFHINPTIRPLSPIIEEPDENERK